MSSIQTIGAKVFRKTLQAETDITDLVQSKVFWEYVPERVAMPYITTHHIVGGHDNDAQSKAVDYIWKIVGHTADMATAITMNDAISKALFRVMPVTTGVTDVEGYVWIEELSPVFDTHVDQGTPFFRVGGLFRLRLSLGDNP